MDLKRELEPGKKANTDLAQDIAAFAIHGGWYRSAWPKVRQSN